MKELAREEFNRVKPLLVGGHLHPEVISIIELNNPGWIFVDQIVKPQSALVWSKGMQGFYLIGDHKNEIFTKNLDNFIKKEIESRMRDNSLKHFEVSGHHDEWDLNSIFSSRKLYLFEQLVLNSSKKPQVIKRNAIKTINLKTQEWTNLELKNLNLISDHINLFWPSKEDFIEKGYGFAAIDGMEIIGVCYSSFVTRHTHAIVIETAAHFQDKGVGTYLATLLVEELIDHGFTPYWDCSIDNEASRKLAIRLGFKQVHSYKCIGFEL